MSRPTQRGSRPNFLTSAVRDTAELLPGDLIQEGLQPPSSSNAPDVKCSLATNTPVGLGIGKETVSPRPSTVFLYVPPLPPRAEEIGAALETTRVAWTARSRRFAEQQSTLRALARQNSSP